MNQVVDKQINFDTMRDTMLNNQSNKQKIVYPSRIRLQADTRLLKNIPETKTFKLEYTKRVVDAENITADRIPTLPYC